MQISCSNRQYNQITSNKCSKDSQISPSVIPAELQRCKVPIASSEGTIAAVARRIRIDQVSNCTLEESRRVFATGFSRRGIIYRQLLRRATYLQVMKLRRHHPSD